jgi:hypothetical protein
MLLQGFRGPTPRKQSLEHPSTQPGRHRVLRPRRPGANVGWGADSRAGGRSATTEATMALEGLGTRWPHGVDQFVNPRHSLPARARRDRVLRTEGHRFLP